MALSNIEPRGTDPAYTPDSVETIEDLIKNNYTLLSGRLQVEKLIPNFIERRLLDFPDKQVIMSKTTAPGKAEALLELLTQKGTCKLEEFVEILEAADHQHVAGQLERTSTRNDTTEGLVNAAADDVIACLKDLYATEHAHVRPLPWCEDLNLHLGEVYTNLRLQRRDDRGHFQDTDTIVSLADIYTLGDNSQVEVDVRKIRVEGDPGIGKSCSCQKLAYDWSCGKLDRFKLFFLLEMRHLAGKVKDAIFEQLLPKDTTLTPDQLWSYIRENQKDVLFILDGLDELSQTARKSTDVVDLIQGKILRNCHVLVTSRPYHCVKDLGKCHQFYKIIGYSKENSEEFIHKYFCKSLDSASKLVEQLQSSSNMSEIAVNPLNNVLICVVWEDNNKQLPSSKDELYRDIVYSVAKRFRTKKDPSMEGDKLPPDIEEALRGLEKLAWEGLEQEQKQLQFNIDEITNEYGTTADNMLNMGLLTRDYSFSRIKRTYYCAFLHKTFQEYMAARYISGLVMVTKCVRRLFGMADATVVNRELVVSCYYVYGQITWLWLLPILGENSRLLFERFAEELSKAQTDEGTVVIFLCVHM
ncbi:NLR family CARD domain-containing protein 4-like [Branchiostoma lanceolatum]|uniref:NLR family CARD domain-containing protein 4-like n=1 Tax=Branchiostoma lanceolatum TaxID=7740 RepID=UPI003456B034